MIPIPKISLRTAIEAGVALLLLILLSIQTVRIEGFKVWPLHITGLKAELADTRTKLADTQDAFDKTVAGYRAAAEQAKRDDAANAARVKAQQLQINQESSDAYEARIAAARAAADRLRRQISQAGANSGSRTAAPVSGIPAATAGSAQAAGQDGFSIADRLTATEQAIQLDELIKWVKKQAGVDVNGNADAVKARQPAPRG